MRGRWLIGMSAALVACGGDEKAAEAPAPTTNAPAVAVLDTTVNATTEATGIAAPMESSTLSTRLMASVVEVLVLEGAVVRQGQTLARLDLRDLAAKRQQAQAGLADAEAQRALARVSADRMRALHADSAAPKAMLDAAEAGLARAEAGVRAATAGLAELEAVAGYGEIRAPFDGVVSHRFVDPGAFVAPGAPIMTVDRLGALRISVTLPTDQARGITAGAFLAATIERDTATARVEGVVRGAGGTSTLNAVVANRSGQWLGGSAATLHLPAGSRRALLIPTAAIRREGDVALVNRRTAQGELVTAVRLGAVYGDRTEVLAGLQASDHVVMPTTARP